MFRFFENSPNDITLTIFTETSCKDQARLAQVSKRFNEIANDKSLKLFKCNSGNFLFQIGDVQIVGKKSENKFAKKRGKNEYDLITTHIGKEVSDSRMVISQKSFGKLVENEGVFSLIEIFKDFGLTGRIIARALKMEHNRIRDDDYLKSFRTTSENLVVQIGDAALVAEKIRENYYELFTIEDEQMSSMINSKDVSKEDFDKLVEKSKEGAFPLIDELRVWEYSGRKHANLLEKALVNFLIKLKP